MLVLSGANTYGSSFTTTVASGALVLANTSGSGTGSSSVSVSGTSATLTGSGTASGSVDNSGNISATNMAGGTATLTTGPLTFDSGSKYQWAINNATGTAGAASGWNQLTVNGSTTINATPLTLNVISLTSGNQLGALATFDNTRDYSWRIIHSTSAPITGFSSGAVTVSSSQFANSMGSAVFTVSTNNGGSGGDVYLNFVHAPSLTLSNLTVGQGSNAVFNAVNTVANSTAATAVYSWKSNGVALADGGRISGSSTPTLTIANVQSGDATTYTVTAANAAGTNSASATLTVGISSTVVTWATPAPIVYGTALSGVQLDATANVQGNFVYTPPVGTVLNAGNNLLSVVFTPTDTNTYQMATNTVNQVVTTAPLTVTANNFTRPQGATNPVFTGNIVGIQNGDNITANYASSATTGRACSVVATPLVPAMAAVATVNHAAPASRAHSALARARRRSKVRSRVVSAALVAAGVGATIAANTSVPNNDNCAARCTPRSRATKISWLCTRYLTVNRTLPSVLWVSTEVACQITMKLPLPMDGSSTMTFRSECRRGSARRRPPRRKPWKRRLCSVNGQNVQMGSSVAEPHLLYSGRYVNICFGIRRDPCQRRPWGCRCPERPASRRHRTPPWDRQPIWKLSVAEASKLTQQPLPDYLRPGGL